MAAEQTGLQPQVFISHTGSDEHGRLFAASILTQTLKAEGLPWFIDHHNLQLGCAWPSELVKAAASSAVFVVVLTQSYATRFWCLRELDIAMHDHLTGAKPYIIPVYLQHHSALKPLTVEQLKSNIEHRMAELAGAQDSAELRDLQRLDPERMLRNLQDLQGNQGARRQHQAMQLYATQEQQQQKPAVLPGSSSSKSSEVHAPKDEEWQIARKVAAAAAQQLPAMHRPVYVPPGLAGYERQLAALMDKLDQPGNCGLWLHGPGGSGKTTMAAVLFNKLSRSTNEFAKAAMVELQLEGNSPDQLTNCLVRVLEDLGEEKPKGSNMQLLQRLTELMQQHKVLLLLDNVNHADQLDSLLPSQFSSGSSRVIITSRDEKLPSSEAYLALTQEDTPALLHHSMETLDTESARIVFRRYHGSSEQEVQKLEAERLQQLKQQQQWQLPLEDQLLQECSSLPLALRVIGGALREGRGASTKDTLKTWQDMHTLLRDGKWDPPEMGSTEARLYGVVYFSFSRLSEAAQNIFLDSVSVLQGQPLSKAMLVWEEWWPGQAQPALQKLKQLSLISPKPGRESRWGHALRGKPQGILDERITTLDVIRWLGQSIILKNDMPGGLGDKYYCSRIWVTSKGEVSPGQELLKDRRPVGVNLGECSPDKVANVLQHLVFSDVRILISHHLPPGVLGTAERLMWIRGLDCSRDFAFAAAEHTDAEICLDKLVVLDLLGSRYGYSFPCAAWEELVGAMAAAAALSSLRALEIDAQLLEDWLSEEQLAKLVSILCCSKKLKQLVVYNLSGKAFLGWLQVPTAQHTDLQLLRLQQAPLMPDAPGKHVQDVLGTLTSLQELYLTLGDSSVRLPASIGCLTALKVLYVSVSNAHLPESFRDLTALEWLHMSGSAGLSSLPESFGGFTALQCLNLEGCAGLSRLPESFGRLGALTELFMSGCTCLRSLPKSFGGLTALQWLELSGCSGLSMLPQSFGGLVALTMLNLEECGALCSLPDSFGTLAALAGLRIAGCHNLSSLPESFGSLAALQGLYMRSCIRLCGLPRSFGGLSVLQRLDLSGCNGLASLPESFGRLTSLSSLHLSDCWSLSILPDSFGGLTALRLLKLPWCVSLSSLPESFGDLVSLEQLDMYNCCKLSSLPASIVQLTGLQEIQVQCCPKLQILPGALARLKKCRKH